VREKEVCVCERAAARRAESGFATAATAAHTYIHTCINVHILVYRERRRES